MRMVEKSDLGDFDGWSLKVGPSICLYTKSVCFRFGVGLIWSVRPCVKTVNLVADAVQLKCKNEMEEIVLFSISL